MQLHDPTHRLADYLDEILVKTRKIPVKQRNQDNALIKIT